MRTLRTDLTSIAIPAEKFAQSFFSACTIIEFILLAGNALQYGGKWSDSNTCSNQNGMFSLEDVCGRSTIWTINENLLVHEILWHPCSPVKCIATSSLLQ